MHKINLSKLFELKLAILLTLTISSALVYRVYSLNTAGIMASLALFSLLLLILAYSGLIFNAWPKPTTNNELPVTKENPGIIAPCSPPTIHFISWSFIALFALLTFTLILSSTTKSIISPWEVIPSWFFYLYLLFLTLGLCLLILFKKQFPVYLIFTINFSVLILTYRIGYGYDFFIHGASLKLIDDIGQVLPKTNFYLGQYGLLIILHKLTLIPLYWLHKLLVPALTIIYLPYFSLKYLAAKKYPGWLAIFILTIPLGFLTYTTPQNFGYLLLIILTLNLAASKSRFDLLLNSLLVITGLTIHPITGIPGLILFALHHCKNKIARVFFLLVALISLPALYLLTLPSAILSWPNLADLVGTAAFALPYKFNYILNSVYLFSFNQLIILLLLILSGFWLARKKSDLSNNSWLSIILLLSSLLMSSVRNSSLITYEQTDYAERLHLIIIIFLLPILFESFAYLRHKIKNQNIQLRLSWLGILIFSIMANFYLSYPRNDNYFNSRGISIGLADLNAVSWINNNSKADYIVLSNQQVSAAALHLYGFKKYYRHDIIKEAEINSSSTDSIFYYPIPTGGPLYRYYLDMVYESPSVETMTAAKQLAGVDTAYFVLNKYWTNFPVILEEAKLTAKNYKSFENGAVYVFEY